jgi:AcrR family transcriptional regulator
MAIHKAVLSTSENRREAVIENALSVFAASGYLGTPVTDIAKRAKISTAYVFKLFPSKEELFVAALERCFELILAALAKGADESADQAPEPVLFAMGGAYAALIADRKLLLLQIHAQSAASVPEIGKAFRKGLETVVRFAKSRSNAPDELVQRFMAYGQLCHLITTVGLDKSPAPWARVLTKGIRHV